MFAFFSVTEKMGAAPTTSAFDPSSGEGNPGSVGSGQEPSTPSTPLSMPGTPLCAPSSVFLPTVGNVSIPALPVNNAQDDDDDDYS